MHWSSTPHPNSIISDQDVKCYNINPIDNDLYNAACNCLSDKNRDITALNNFMRKFKKGEMEDYFSKRRKWFFDKNDILTCSKTAIQNAFNDNKMPNPTNKETGLMVAVIKNDKSAVETLLQNGADTEQKDAKGLTAFNYALAYDRNDIKIALDEYNELRISAKRVLERNGKKFNL